MQSRRTRKEAESFLATKNSPALFSARLAPLAILRPPSAFRPIDLSLHLPPSTFHLLVVAVSGGADSVALLHALRSLANRRYRLAVAHLNHGIRGKAGEEDARFVRALARKWKLKYVCGRVDVPALARQRGISIEMAAREARYDFLARTAKRLGAAAIATAHTADDQAETVLLKLLRGAGPAGLAGIPPETKAAGVRVVRPILNASRRDVIAYLQRHKLAWREDETNRDRGFLRNRVRHELLPLLERGFNPKIRAVLARTADILRAEDDWMNAAARKVMDRAAARKGHALRWDSLRDQPLALRRRAIRIWLAREGVPVGNVDFDMVDRVDRWIGRKSPRLSLPGGWEIRRTGQTLSVGPVCTRIPKPFRIRLAVPGTTTIPELGLRITTKLAPGVAKDRGGKPGQWPAQASLALDAWRRRALYVRSWRAGDRMTPFGLAGTKKIQDIFVDAKIPRGERGLIPLLECGGEIAWVPSYRIARHWAIADARKPALQIAVTRLAR